MRFSLALISFLLSSGLADKALADDHGAAGAFILSASPEGGIDYGKYGKIQEGEPIILLGLEWDRTLETYIWSGFDGNIELIEGGIAEPAREAAWRTVKKQLPSYDVPLGKFHNSKSAVSSVDRTYIPQRNIDPKDAKSQRFAILVPYQSVKEIELSYESQRLRAPYPFVGKCGWMWVPLADFIGALGNVSLPRTTTLFSGDHLCYVRSSGIPVYKHDLARAIPNNEYMRMRTALHGNILNLKAKQHERHLLEQAYERLKRGKTHWSSDPVVLQEGLETLYLVLGFDNVSKDQAVSIIAGIKGAEQFIDDYHVTIASINNLTSDECRQLKTYLNGHLQDSDLKLFEVSFTPADVDRYMVNRWWKKGTIVVFPENPEPFELLNLTIKQLLKEYKPESGRRYKLSSDTHPDNFAPHYTLLYRETDDDAGYKRQEIINALRGNLSSVDSNSFVFNWVFMDD